VIFVVQSANEETNVDIKEAYNQQTAQTKNRKYS
jgi:hypothetical protein